MTHPAMMPARVLKAGKAAKMTTEMPTATPAARQMLELTLRAKATALSGCR